MTHLLFLRSINVSLINIAIHVKTDRTTSLRFMRGNNSSLKNRRGLLEKYSHRKRRKCRDIKKKIAI